MKSFMDSGNEETINAILEMIREEPRGLTITDIALHMKLNRNTVRKYTLMLTAGGYIEERTCGHTKVFSISNRIPLTSILDYAMEGIMILDENSEISYNNLFFKDNLGLELKDLKTLVRENSLSDAIKKTAITGFTEKKLTITTKKGDFKELRARLVSANSFNGEKKTVIYVKES